MALYVADEMIIEPYIHQLATGKSNRMNSTVQHPWERQHARDLGAT